MDFLHSDNHITIYSFRFIRSFLYLNHIYYLSASIQQTKKWTRKWSQFLSGRNQFSFFAHVVFDDKMIQPLWAGGGSAPSWKFSQAVQPWRIGDGCRVLCSCLLATKLSRDSGDNPGTHFKVFNASSATLSLTWWQWKNYSH